VKHFNGPRKTLLIVTPSKNRQERQEKVGRRYALINADLVNVCHGEKSNSLYLRPSARICG